MNNVWLRADICQTARQRYRAEKTGRIESVSWLLHTLSQYGLVGQLLQNLALEGLVIQVLIVIQEWLRTVALFHSIETRVAA